MSAHASIATSRELDPVLGILNELAHKSNSGTFVFRGEPALYPETSSGLYRRYGGMDDTGSAIETIQAEILAQAKAHAPHLDDMMELDILAQLQHNGGETNLIDFTTDYLIALFFTCDGEPGQSGRVILLSETGEGYYIYRPTSPVHRVIAQRSLFVQPDRGFVEPDDTLVIASELKQPILDYLHRHHGISTETMYNDLYGFIRHQGIHNSAYDELYKGVTLANKKEYRQAIQHYDKALTLNPRMATAYNHRGEAYYRLGEYASAIDNYEHALTFGRDNYAVYNNLGLVYAAEGNHRRAIECYDQALELSYDDDTRYYRFESLLHLEEWEAAKEELRFAALGLVNFAALMREDYANVSDFENKNGLTLPDDIAEFLGGREASI